MLRSIGPESTAGPATHARYFLGLAEAIARQGLLRYQQGRLDEAGVLFEQVLYFPPAQLGMGRLALDLGEAETAREHAERYLRHIPHENRTERVGGLEVLARAQLALGKLDAAHLTLDELIAISDEVGTGPLLAITKLVAGLVAAGSGDHARARSLLEDAADLFAHSGAPYEMGRARLALGHSLEALGRVAAAEREAQVALLALRELGAERQAAQAEALVKRLQHARRLNSDELHTPQPLSARQKEVLTLIAQGASDQQIAAQLMLSPYTVHRHVTNILARLDVPSRSAAVAFATRAGLI